MTVPSMTACDEQLAHALVPRESPAETEAARDRIHAHFQRIQQALAEEKAIADRERTAQVELSDGE